MPKIVKKLWKSGYGGCFGRSGGLPGAMSSRLGRRSAKMHTRSPQIGPIWSHLGGQVGAKISKKIDRKIVKFLAVFRTALGDEHSTKITPKWRPKSTPRRFPKGLEAKVVKVWFRTTLQRFSLIWGSSRLGRRRKIAKKTTEIASNFQETLEIDFGWFLEAKLEAKSIEINFDWKIW